MRFFVYILECADKSLYVGCTNNMQRRLHQHNYSKVGAHYTKIRRPVSLLYQEILTTLKEARRRESEIKGWRREKKILLIQTKHTPMPSNKNLVEGERYVELSSL